MAIRPDDRGAEAFPPWTADGRPRVLAFTLHYFPSTKGLGPSRSIAGAVTRLTGDFQFRVLSADRDDPRGGPYEGVTGGLWVNVGGVPVRYCLPAESSLHVWARLLRSIPADLYYLNSMFSWMTLKTLVLRRIGVLPRIPVVIAPRGEFAAEALALKPLRKSVFLHGAEAAGLLRDVVFQASSHLEEADIAARMPRHAADVVVAMDISSAAASETTADTLRKTPGEIRLVLVGRVVPMKNVEFAIRVLSGLAERVELDVIGSLEDPRYWNECLRAIDRLPGNVTVRHAGELRHEEVRARLPSYHAFFLPSRGENYCHAIVEALSAGLPVLISDRTPWSGVREHGAGWVFGIEGVEAARACIREAASLDGPALRGWSERAKAMGKSITASSAAVDQTRSLFQRALRRIAACENRNRTPAAGS